MYNDPSRSSKVVNLEPIESACRTFYWPGLNDNLSATSSRFINIKRLISMPKATFPYPTGQLNRLAAESTCGRIDWWPNRPTHFTREPDVLDADAPDAFYQQPSLAASVFVRMCIVRRAASA